ncbi:hypothetical protein L227DRAFT_86213 [Lentinus tigrinus ALCF2SS1-6]|uniref:Uncharacterized protein n=1 Tax=Lentinus tigrinus ALCF2SS1-6 TaxID=1328759 RepID=A0A5C2SAT8_9APHY|nr:hypothetical protein L227DRAFT_86213 [Lentinus tigrinus ALCF2SS1-6]
MRNRQRSPWCPSRSPSSTNSLRPALDTSSVWSRDGLCPTTSSPPQDQSPDFLVLLTYSVFIFRLATSPPLLHLYLLCDARRISMLRSSFFFRLFSSRSLPFRRPTVRCFPADYLYIATTLL